MELEINKDAKIYIAGHNGMVGSAIKRNLEVKGFKNIITRSSSELNLLKEIDVAKFFTIEKPEYVVLAAAKVGGIVANNTYRAQFIYENLMIQNHVIHQSYLHNVKKLIFFGSSCIYPKMSKQPIKESELLTGVLESTNEPYAIAKITGIKMCEAYHDQYGCNFISIMPTNLYGQNDNYDLKNSHVLPALIRKMTLGKLLQEENFDAIRKNLTNMPIDGVTGDADNKTILQCLERHGISYSDKNIINPSKNVNVTVWGTGTAMREFLHVDDLADASVYLLLYYNASNTKSSHINVGCGEDISIKELAELIQNIIGFEGYLIWDNTKPDGTPRKLLDISKLTELGWSPRISLEYGISRVVLNYKY